MYPTTQVGKLGFEIRSEGDHLVNIKMCLCLIEFIAHLFILVNTAQIVLFKCSIRYNAKH